MASSKVGNYNSGWYSPEYPHGDIIFPTQYYVPDIVPYTAPDNPITLTSILNNIVQTVKQPVTNCECLVGTPYIDENGVCKCRSDGNIDATEPTAPIKIPQTTATPTTPNAPTTSSEINIIDKLKENPILALAGAGVLAYLILKK